MKASAHTPGSGLFAGAGPARRPASSSRSDSGILLDESRYQAWRARCLARAAGIADTPVHLHDPCALSAAEKHRLRDSVARAGFAIYAFPAHDCGNAEDRAAEKFITLCHQLGLDTPLSNPAAGENGLSRIEAVPPVDQAKARDRARYIPYSRQRLQWHTDGYYYPDSRRVGAFALHCVRDAARGGDNRLLDGNRLYIALRDHAPRLAHALCHPDALTIPGDQGTDGTGRPTFRGPVFAFDSGSDSIYTRYTRRRHNIRWRDDGDTRAALSFIDELLDSDHPAISRWRLAPGQGILCNNVLHCREAFEDREGDGQGRLVYRLRFPRRIAPVEAMP